MGFQLFDFKCARGHLHEAMVSREERIDTCPVCGFAAHRQLAAPRISLDGISGDFPTAADKWEKNRESHMEKERRNMERHGTYK